MNTPIPLHLCKSTAARTGAACALVLACLVLGASTASARNEFKNGFEDELGRIVAHRVAMIGRAVLLSPVVVREQVYVERPRPRVVPRPRVWRPRPHARFRSRHSFPRHHRHWAPWRGHRGPRHLHRHGCRHRHVSTRVTVVETGGGPRHLDREHEQRAGWRTRHDRYGD